MNANLEAIARNLGCHNIRGANKGINADKHIFADAIIKGETWTVSLKMPNFFDKDSGSVNEVNSYDAARLLRAFIPWDGANVTYARLEGGAAFIRHLDGGMRLDEYAKMGGARNLSLARSYGRMLVLWAILGMPDRHKGNFLIVPADKGGRGGALWSIDHEARPDSGASLKWIHEHIAIFAKCNGIVANIPVANGRAHVSGVYHMDRFLHHARSEMCLMLDRLETAKGAEILAKIEAMKPRRLNSAWKDDILSSIQILGG